jgi:hypothetical protein
MNVVVYPIAHGASGYACGHPKTMDLSTGEYRELHRGGDRSLRNADHSLSLVWDSHRVIDFWLDCFAIHRRFNRAVIRFATGF